MSLSRGGDLIASEIQRPHRSHSLCLVGSQGVEPRVSRGRLVYSQLQSPVLLAARSKLVRTTGLEPMASTLATSRSASELHPQTSIPESFRASGTLTLARASKSSHQLRLSPRRRKHLSACWTRVCAAHRRTRRAMRDPGESPDLQFCLLNSVLAERAAQGSIRTARTNPYRGLHLADGTLFWVGFRRL
jgi:hypothetical protein